MARPKTSTFDKVKTVAENRRARFDYFVEDGRLDRRGLRPRA
jgi:SsrA-binding protein